MRNFIFTMCVIFCVFADRYASAQSFWYTPPGYDFGYYYGLDVGQGVGFGYGGGVGITIPPEAFAPQTPALLEPQSWDEFESSTAWQGAPQRTSVVSEYRATMIAGNTKMKAAKAVTSKKGASIPQNAKVTKKVSPPEKAKKLSTSM